MTDGMFLMMTDNQRPVVASTERSGLRAVTLEEGGCWCSLTLAETAC
jgi:hypothetical protein